MSTNKLARKLCQERGCQTPWRSAATQRCHRHRPRQPQPKRPPLPAVCTIDGCPNEVQARGRCNMHQYEQYRQLQPEAMALIEAGLMQWIEPTDTGCWVYTHAAMKDRGGYGKFMPDGRWALVHKWLFMHLVGPVPDGHQLHHECHNRPCCRPGHLTPIKPGEHAKLTAANAAFRARFPDEIVTAPDRSHTDRERRFAAVYALPADTTITMLDLDGLMRPSHQPPQ